MKLLVDMNLSPRWVRFLIDAGFDSVHWSDTGSGEASDAEILEWAAERDCVVLTADLDFGAILAASRQRQPSVVQLRSDNLDPSHIGESLVAALRQSRQSLLAGALISVDIGRARLRVLPFEQERGD